MSTRCQIVVEGSPVYIYKHSDGYPAGVLPTLVPFLKEFKADRGFDESYLVAQIVRCFARADQAELAEDLAEYVSQEEEASFLARMTRASHHLGWGLD